MIIWIDAQLSPALAPWIEAQFSINAKAVRELGLRNSTDREIFLAARANSAVVMTKDRDFVRLLEQFGPPPQIIWVTCGNTSNHQLMQILVKIFPSVVTLLNAGERLVEVSDRW